jgi:hypothetical protein
LIWAEKTHASIPAEAVEGAVKALGAKFPDGQIRIERQSYEGTGTILQDGVGVWQRGQPATFFPLLQSVSRMGEVSPFLTQQWLEARRRLSSHQNLRKLLTS